MAWWLLWFWFAGQCLPPCCPQTEAGHSGCLCGCSQGCVGLKNWPSDSATVELTAKHSQHQRDVLSLCCFDASDIQNWCCSYIVVVVFWHGTRDRHWSSVCDFSHDYRRRWRGERSRLPLVSAWGCGLQAALTAIWTAHQNDQLKCPQSSCIVGNMHA